MHALNEIVRKHKMNCGPESPAEEKACTLETCQRYERERVRRSERSLKGDLKSRSEKERDLKQVNSTNQGFSWWLSGKEPPVAKGLIPWSERAPGEGNGNPLQYSHLGNPMDRGAWWL